MLYDKLSYSNITLHDVDGVQLPFSKDWKKIGINLSGGADSACLTMLLANIINEHSYNCEIHIISYVRGWITKPWQSYVSMQVFDKLKTMFPSIIKTRHEYFMSVELEYGATFSNACSAVGQDFSNYITFHEGLDAVFNATSSNPPFYIEGQVDSRTVDKNAIDISELIYLDTYKDFKVFRCCPLVCTSKDWIVKQYYANNAIDLLDTTRSCEGEFANLDFTNYVQGQYVPICNKCFWCKERKWAMDLNA